MYFPDSLQTRYMQDMLDDPNPKLLKYFHSAVYKRKFRSSTELLIPWKLFFNDHLCAVEIKILMTVTVIYRM